MFRTKCGCEWPDGCNGTGTLYCDGCGGDICVCICGGEMECPGCETCEAAREIEDEEVEDEELEYER